MTGISGVMAGTPLSDDAKALRDAFQRLAFWELPTTFGAAIAIADLGFVEALAALSELRDHGLIEDACPA